MYTDIMLPAILFFFVSEFFYVYLLPPNCLHVISGHGEWDEVRVSIALERMG